MQKADASKLDAILAGRLQAGMSFSERVWTICSRVPVGKVTTYAAIARELGCRAPRAVGQALHRNPHAPQVPCHRVIGTNRTLTGYAGGLPKKQQMLIEEGVEIEDGRVAKRCIVG